MKKLKITTAMSKAALKKIKGGAVLCSETTCSRLVRCCLDYACIRGRCVPL